LTVLRLLTLPAEPENDGSGPQRFPACLPGEGLAFFSQCAVKPLQMCYYSAMTRIAKLKNDGDHIKNAELDHEEARVSLRLSPRATFILDSMQHRLGVTRTRAVTELVEAAVLDWVESLEIDPEGEEFKKTYYRWLTRQPIDVGSDGEEYFELVTL
jgi:hypothetical protein